ncbi:mechanosensitive ion channel [Rubrobacter marinus]|uniref:Mechanosensitive ion channel n=1 Tax=Rubrobacter marinus TaxID=2653852 RepID=A0A6G8PTE2_9ACTN|nr:mechanosensitive ion channel family protein [Rubrobacter marinus]QIN77778.1 mechanosensitive ion channel [Rubrobacter marinus]
MAAPVYGLVLLLQETMGETTGVVEQAEQAAGQLNQETSRSLDTVRAFFESIGAYVTSPEFFAKIIASIVVVALGILFYRLLTHGVPRVLRWRRRHRRRTLDAEAVARLKRQNTAITLGRNALRYMIALGIALFVLSIFIGNPLPATAGATVFVATVGFGAQSLLRDIIAGFSIVFEGQYSVGDFIEVEPTKAAGLVEELGLRTTKIRALSGELIFIPNGTIMGVRNYVSGEQRFTIEVQLSEASAVEKVLGSLKEASNLYLLPPRLVGRDETDGRTRLRILAGVLPSMAWLVEENLVERIKAAAGEEALAAEPLIYKVDQANLAKIRSLIPDEDDEKG